MPQSPGGRKGRAGVAALSGMWGRGEFWGLPRALWRGAGGVLEMRFGKMWVLVKLSEWV